MENAAALALPALMTLLALKLLLKPLRWGCRAAVRGLAGMVCLWLVNSAAWITGLYLPVNAVTVLLAGALGLPGIALAALLEVIS